MAVGKANIEQGMLNVDDCRLKQEAGSKKNVEVYVFISEIVSEKAIVRWHSILILSNLDAH